MKILAFLTVVLVASAAGLAHADIRRITVSGTGTVETAPDMATITLGVTNHDAEAAVAMEATSRSVAQILTRLQSLGLAERDIQTRDLSLTPIWTGRHGQDGKAPEITGFAASNRVMVRVRELDQLGTVLDAVIRDGANDFNGLSFGVQDPKPLTDEARARAVADAMDKARQLADAAGVTLGAIVSITDQNGGGRPMMRMAEMAMSDAGGVPVAAGEISVERTISMVFEIAE